MLETSRRDVVDAREAFREHQPIRRRLLVSIGLLGRARFNHTPISDDKAEIVGRHRVRAVAGLGVVALVGLPTLYFGSKAVVNHIQGENRYKERVEECASELTGHEVDTITVDQGVRVEAPVEDSRAVFACQLAGGDVDAARDRLPEIKESDVPRPLELG